MIIFLKTHEFKCGFNTVIIKKKKKRKIYLNNNKILICDALFLVQVNPNYKKQRLGSIFWMVLEYE